MKTSLGIWALGPMVTRFVPGGYQPQWARRVDGGEGARARSTGLGDLMDGYEFHYPGELSPRQPRRGARARSTGTTSTASRAGCTSTRCSARAGSRSPDDAVRDEAIRRTLDGVDFAARGRRALHHLAGDRGLQLPVPDAVRGVVGALHRRRSGRPRERATERGVTIFLEHKNSEPAMKILMRNVGMTLHVIHKLRARGSRQRQGQHGLAAPDHERREPRRVRGAARRGGPARPPARELGLGHLRRRQHGRRDGVHGDARARARAAARRTTARTGSGSASTSTRTPRTRSRR